MVEFNCPECAGSIQIADETKGRGRTCPNCGATVAIPDELQRNPSEIPSTNNTENAKSMKSPYCGLRRKPFIVIVCVLFAIMLLAAICCDNDLAGEIAFLGIILLLIAEYLRLWNAGKNTIWFFFIIVIPFLNLWFLGQCLFCKEATKSQRS